MRHIYRIVNESTMYPIVVTFKKGATQIDDMFVIQPGKTGEFPLQEAPYPMKIQLARNAPEKEIT